MNLPPFYIAYSSNGMKRRQWSVEEHPVCRVRVAARSIARYAAMWIVDGDQRLQ